MNTNEISTSLAGLFRELTLGVSQPAVAYILNTGDLGLLRSLDKLSAADASHSSSGGATVAAHARHLAYGLSLMNRWAREGGNPFADATWEKAWKTSTVDEPEWKQIRSELAEAVREWSEVLSTPREATAVDLSGMVGSIAHLAYHLGAIRQIVRIARGPKEGTYSQ